MDTISWSDFEKVLLVAGTVTRVERFPEARKPAYRIWVDFGPYGEKKTSAQVTTLYAPEDLVGRLVICCANLAPRKMRFGVSEGMVCAAGAGGKEIFVLTPDSGAKPGMRVH